MTYGAERPWLVLALLSLTGLAVRHVFNLRNSGKPTQSSIVVAVALALLSVTYVSTEPRAAASPPVQAAGAPAASFAAIQPILQKHCVSCHAAAPTDAAITSAPLGVMLETWEQVSAAAPRIKQVAVDSDVMPLGNPTGMTAAERSALGAWIDSGNPK